MVFKYSVVPRYEIKPGMSYKGALSRVLEFMGRPDLPINRDPAEWRNTIGSYLMIVTSIKESKIIYQSYYVSKDGTRWLILKGSIADGGLYKVCEREKFTNSIMWEEHIGALERLSNC